MFVHPDAVRRDSDDEGGGASSGSEAAPDSAPPDKATLLKVLFVFSSHSKTHHLLKSEFGIFRGVLQKRREECERKARRGEMDPRLEFTFQMLIDATGLSRGDIMDNVFEGNMVTQKIQLNLGIKFHFLMQFQYHSFFICFAIFFVYGIRQFILVVIARLFYII
jgi:hypothetical protein